MSAGAATLTYWGQQWGTSTTTTDLARRNSEAEGRSESAQKIVFVVAPQQEAGFSTRARELRYRVPGLSKLLPRMFIVEAPAGSFAVRSTAQSVAIPEVDPSAWRGVFSIHPTRNVLFPQTMEIRIETLRRLTPRIHIDRRTSERQNA